MNLTAPLNNPEHFGEPINPPVLSADEVHISVDGATVLAGVQLRTQSNRVLLSGMSTPLMNVLTGLTDSALRFGPEPSTESPSTETRIVSGKLQLLGRDVASRQHHAIAGFAPLDPPLPQRWSVKEYLKWAARLSGHGSRHARLHADATLQKLQLEKLGKRQLKTLSKLQRRAVVIAQAMVTDPAVLIVQNPLTGLSEQAARTLLDTLNRALANRSAILSVARLSPTGPASELPLWASEVCLFGRGILLAHAAPQQLFAGARLFEVTVQDNWHALSEQLLTRGATFSGGPHHYAITLPATMGLRDILAAAVAAQAPVIDCVPLWP